MKVLSLNVKGIKIPVVFESSKALAVASLKLVFKVAGACCDDKKAGLAKMAASILNEGTMSLKNTEFARLLEMRAISLNVSAGFETLNIEINCLKEHFDYAINMLKELLSEPNLSQDAFMRCKNLTLGEIASNENDYDYLAKNGLFELLYPDTPLAYPSIGTNESIKNISLDEIKNFITNHLDLANLFIVFGGDISESELEKIAKILEILNVSNARTLPKFSPLSDKKTKEIIKQSEQAYIYFGAPYNVEKSERFKAKVATFILAQGGFGARLMEEIRVKRGLAYSIYAQNIFNLSYSQIFGYMQTKNEKKDEAIAVIKDEIAKFTKNGAKASELAQAKKFLLGSLPLRLETLFHRLNIAQNEFYNSEILGAYKSELEQISSLKLSLLNEFISSHDEINNLSFCVLRSEI